MSMMLLRIYFGAVVMLLPQLVLRFTFMADSGEVNDDGCHFWCFSALVLVHLKTRTLLISIMAVFEVVDL